MKAVWSSLIGVTCLASFVLSGGCEVQSVPDGSGLGLGDTTPTQQGDAAAGAVLFAANGCSTCHGEDGSGGFGPSIRSVQVERLAAKLQDSTVGHTGGLFPDLSAQDLADIAAFLGDSDVPTAPSGPLHSVDMKNTGILHAQGFSDPTTNCVACHGSDLSGSPPAPSCFTCHGPLWSGGGPPPSHTDVLTSGNVTGAHLPGRDNPTANCTACHQNDLMGRFRVPSCYSCHGSKWDGPPDVPPTHTVANDGVLHAPGFESPATNCASCHGSDLSGTSLIPSCFTCHGPLWSGGGPPPSHTDVLTSGHVTGAHLPGRDNPTANCTACHQNDLTGHFHVPSCFSCHGPLWSGGGPPPSHTDVLSRGDVTGAHFPGRYSPSDNCASCHQSDLFGTSLIPACWSCHGSIWDGPPNYPPTHTKLEHGFHHDPGLETPVNNCDACHGSDLMGTPLIPSCFSCHGDKWNDDRR